MSRPEFPKLATKFKGKESHVHCFAHILNLVVKAILRQFNTPKNFEASGGADESDRVLEELTKDTDDEVDDERDGEVDEVDADELAEMEKVVNEEGDEELKAEFRSLRAADEGTSVLAGIEEDTSEMRIPPQTWRRNGRVGMGDFI
ncbi:hypothetical protein BKA70DRAFT_1539382 [Coprinopsis sp. MPI-PUGE-AT-0042]|nr:hypothetical protein BKA70DRAFT_1539382 [Coprinopsis sp. MPI-PUGE-AT-0042]